VERLETATNVYNRHEAWPKPQ